MPRDSRATTLPSPDLDRLASRIGDWLIREARFFDNNTVVLQEFCTRVAAAGIAIDRVSLHQRALHPVYRGVSRIWRSGGGEIEELFLDHGIEKTATYLESPVRGVVEDGDSYEWRLDGGGALPFALLEELRDQGYAHYAIAPLPYTVGMFAAISWATRRSGGFTAAEMQFFRDVLPQYSVVAELKALRRFIGSILDTYVGREAGQLILDGQVRRGDTKTITAALMLVDLRDFTMLSDRLSPQAVLRMLNQYFDCVMPPIHEHGGEVVEIMGDGVLAIFNHDQERSAAAACGAALAAAEAGLAALAARNQRHPAVQLNAGVALHYGTVSYGNIGSGERLDFTVIGPDVNLTSRIERLCRELDRSLIVSEAFAETVDRQMWEIGHFGMRGFAKMQRLFEPPQD
ncbi:MAG: adenylate/guanylate cyclase domain-containing protein [Alphaproteobacteria bacterium]|nr:adenylate/guanylate cyclase domain-containing protein [Alphaproteobacteria bacterium]